MFEGSCPSCVRPSHLTTYLGASVSHTDDALPLPADPADDACDLREQPPRVNVFETLPASATAISTVTDEELHASLIVPTGGLVILVLFNDLMHDERMLSAYLVGLAIRSRQEGIASPIPVFAFGPVASPGRRQLATYMRGVVRTMDVFLVDTKASNLFRILNAAGTNGKPYNASYLVKDGTIVWENIPTRADALHDIDGLLAAIARYTAE